MGAGKGKTRRASTKTLTSFSKPKYNIGNTVRVEGSSTQKLLETIINITYDHKSGLYVYETKKTKRNDS